jgi:RNA polymerase sigma-70 factor (ECF subfamily)
MNVKACTDLELAQAIIAGDEVRFNQFFADYYPRLFRFILSRINQDKDLADDFTQQTLCNALDKMAGYRGDAALFTWICQIARSVIHAHFIKENRRNNILQPIAEQQEMRNILENIAMSEQNQPENITENQQLGYLITEIMDSLPNNYGDILEWKYVENLTVEQIAANTNSSIISVQSSLARARKSFKSVIQKVLKNDHLISSLASQLEY